jgi:hypothetical protein
MNGKTHRISRIHVSPGSEYPKAGQSTLYAIAYDANQLEQPLTMRIFALDETGIPIPQAKIQVEIISDDVEVSDGFPAVHNLVADEKSAAFTMPQACMENLFSFTLSVHASAPFDQTESVAVVVRFAPIGIPIADDEEEVTDPVKVDPARILQEFTEQLKLVAALSESIQPLLDKVTGLPKDVLAIKRHLAQIQKQADGFAKLPDSVAALLAKPIKDAISSVTNEMAALRTAIQGERQAVLQTVQTEVANAFATQTAALEAVVKGLPTKANGGSGAQTKQPKSRKWLVAKRGLVVTCLLAICSILISILIKRC